jgi:hypothetical protein
MRPSLWQARQFYHFEFLLVLNIAIRAGWCVGKIHWKYFVVGRFEWRPLSRLLRPLEVVGFWLPPYLHLKSDTHWPCDSPSLNLFKMQFQHPLWNWKSKITQITWKDLKILKYGAAKVEIDRRKVVQHTFRVELRQVYHCIAHYCYLGKFVVLWNCGVFSMSIPSWHPQMSWIGF